ncbi:hypothetical protein BIW53_01965 [Pseudoalteromonas byunsanensis]|uniref:Uncharacterized protein n=1 Tax=Pseudoalteromonas byunsanensis TaxID=327939 RepID=A0A1S1NDD7_9GAMM|nr:hypothetical protein BIW53_01965 [Pseudoalteromonas byunsanensis]
MDIMTIVHQPAILLTRKSACIKPRMIRFFGVNNLGYIRIIKIKPLFTCVAIKAAKSMYATEW